MSNNNTISKKDRIIFWTVTLVIVLFDSGGAFFFNSQLAIDGMRHLGFPDYFRVELTIGKIIGGFLLLIPSVPHRLKEWAYAGFGITFISAIIGHIAVGDGAGVAAQPLFGFVLMIISYVYYQKLRNARTGYEYQDQSNLAVN